MPEDHVAGCVVLSCRDLAAGQAFFASLGFRLLTVFPADAPRQLELGKADLRICLQQSDTDGGGHLRLPGDTTRVLIAPNGARIEFQGPGAPCLVTVSSPPIVVHRGTDGSACHEGRAGMLYRDLLPDRLGGAVIASHIRIPQGGPVPDYVHFHRLTAQALYVVAGWVRVVYEDQGDPLVMQAGDCVLQPPHIRHRVLACSDGLEVIEVSTPAEHVTCVEHDITLPTPTYAPERRFAGQRFHHHQGGAAESRPVPILGLRERDCGIGVASAGAISVRVLTREQPDMAPGRLDGAPTLRLWFPLRGAITLDAERLNAGDTCRLGCHRSAALSAASPDLEVLEFALPVVA